VGAEEGAKAPGGQPLRVTRKGRAEIAAPESGRSPQQKLTAPASRACRRDVERLHSGAGAPIAQPRQCFSRGLSGSSLMAE
jgi:hypothetical protein